MRILKDFKVPDFKFPKFKMPGLSEIEELKANAEADKNKSKKKVHTVKTMNYKTIKEIFTNSIEEFKDYPFILEKFDHKQPYKEISFGEYGKDVISLGTGLNKILGLENKRVVIIGENTYHWYISYMAMLCGVGIAVPVDKELPANEIENVVKRSRASAIIYSHKKKAVIEELKDTLPEVEYFIEMYSDEKVTDRDVGLNYVMETGRQLVKSGDDSFMKIEIDPEEFKVLIFTSGTTSNSKGVMICNRNLAENINAAYAYVKISTDDRLMSILPLHHTYESTIGYLFPLATGASIAVCEGLKYIVPNLKESKPTALLTVPLLVENLYKKIKENIVKSKKENLVNSMIHITNALKTVNIDIKKKVFSEIYNNLGGNIRIIVSAAAPIDEKIGKWLEDIGILFIQGYGLTETAPIAALTPEDKLKVGSAGKAVVCDEIKIDNPNENGEGEILIKGSTLMLGYYEDDEATKEAIVDGWFHSGDIGYLDENGFLYITGRCKNVIVTQNGKNIYPEEIELMLGEVVEIKECMVYGLEEKNEKDLKIAVKVIPNYEKIKELYGEDVTDEQIYKIIWDKIKEINKKLTSYKAIKHLEIKKDEFVKTSTMKIKRYAELSKDKVSGDVEN